MRDAEGVYYIYKITNIINNKLYIGQTSKDIETRFKQHCKNDSGCIYLKRALDKYGKENFIIEIIDTAKTKEEADEKETHYMLLSNSISPNGYNLKTQGRCSFLTTEIKEKISQALRGRKLSEEHARKVKQNLSGPHVNEKLKSKMIKTKHKRPTINKDSGYKGVCWDKQRKKWKARIGINNKDIVIGFFINVDAAAKAYDEAARKYYGSDCYLNFPQEDK